MRPKKLIVVFDKNDTSLGVTMFALSVNGYRVAGAKTQKDVQNIHEKNDIDAILVKSEKDCKLFETKIPIVARKNLDMAGVLHELKIACIKKAAHKRVGRRQNLLARFAKLHNT